MGIGNGVLFFNVYEVSFEEDEKVMEMDGGDGCPKLEYT